jgi:hypothetical protein
MSLWKKIWAKGSGSGGGSSASLSFPVVQSNSYSDLQPVYWNGLIWVLANSSLDSSIGTAVISDVTSTGFTVNFIGMITKTAHGLGSGGQFLYVTSVAGTWTTTKPTTGNSNPLAFIHDANTIIVMNYRASKTQVNFSDMAEGFDLTGHGSQILTVKSDASGLEGITTLISSIVAGQLAALTLKGAPVSADVVMINDSEDSNSVKKATVGSFPTGVAPSNPFVFTNLSTKPATPTSGLVNMQMITDLARPMLNFTDEFGSNEYIQNAMWNKNVTILTPNSSTSARIVGDDYSQSGTLSTIEAAAATFGRYTNAATGASANQPAGLAIYGLKYNYSNTPGYNGGFFVVLKAIFPDADYGSGATGTRAFAGLLGNATMSNGLADNPAYQRIAFMFSTNIAGEVNWMISSRDAGGTEQRDSSGIAFVATHVYDFYFYAPKNSAHIYCKVDDLTAGTTSGILDVTAHLPATTTFMKAGIMIQNLTTTSRNVGIRYEYGESNV